MFFRYLARLLLGSLCAGACVAAQTVIATPSMASEDDAAFIRRAARDGVCEIRLGQLALDRSSNDKLRQLARHMVDDRSHINADLRALAHGKQIVIRTLTEDGSGTQVDRFKDMVGAEFDQTWIDTMVKHHQRTVARFSTETRQAQDRDVRNFAEQTLPALDRHLQMAHALQDALVHSDARNGLLDARKPMGSSRAFDHVSSPATASSADATPAAPATSIGIH